VRAIIKPTKRMIKIMGLEKRMLSMMAVPIIQKIIK
jgi:hypothetical protein